MSEAAYSIPWYCCSKRFRKVLLLFIIRSQKPLQVSMQFFLLKILLKCVSVQIADNGWQHLSDDFSYISITFEFILHLFHYAAGLVPIMESLFDLKLERNKTNKNIHKRELKFLAYECHSTVNKQFIAI